MAVTAIECEERGDARLTPAVVVWANCAPLYEAGLPVGVDEQGVLLLHVTAAAKKGNAARLTLRAGGFLDDATADEFEITVPLVMLGLLVGLEQSNVRFDLFIYDGKPPRRPEFAMVRYADAAALVSMSSTGIVGSALTDAVVSPLQQPLLVVNTEQQQHGDTARELLLPMFAGVTMGSEAAWWALAEFAKHMQALAAQDEPDEEDQQRLLILQHLLTKMLSESQTLVAESGFSFDPSEVPSGMTMLVRRLTEQVNGDVVVSLNEDADNLAACAEETDVETVTLATAALIAKRAWALYQADKQSGVRPTWLVANWMIENGEPNEPWWAFQALAKSLSHHDTAVLTDLMSTRPEGLGSEKFGPMLRDFLHNALVPALLNLDLPAAQLPDRLNGNDVRPRNMPDVVLLCETLLRDAQDAIESGAAESVCPACLAMQAMAMYSWPVDRLAAAASSALAVLSDLAASDLSTGDESWVERREQFLDEYLHLAAH